MLTIVLFKRAPIRLGPLLKRAHRCEAHVNAFLLVQRALAGGCFLVVWNVFTVLDRAKV